MVFRFSIFLGVRKRCVPDPGFKKELMEVSASVGVSFFFFIKFTYSFLPSDWFGIIRYIGHSNSPRTYFIVYNSKYPE